MQLRPRHLIAGLALASSLALGTTALAQEATPGATPGGPSEGFPVAVHEGTCDNPTAEPLFDLGNAVAPGTGEDEPETVGQQTGAIVLQTDGTIDATLDDLGNAPHVVAVHQSPEEYDTIIACGEIAGIKTDGRLVVALAPVGDSTTVGVAVFNEDESGVLGLGEDQVQGTVYVFDTQTSET